MARIAGNRSRILALSFLAIAITAGLIFINYRLNSGTPLTISSPEPPAWQGQIYIGGQVSSPGFYNYRADDTIASLLRAAGGSLPESGGEGLTLSITRAPVSGEPQKININRAEAWLLQALPGIGPTLAERIVEYRQNRGPFNSITELQNVEGIGASIYDGISRLITVAD